MHTCVAHWAAGTQWVLCIKDVHMFADERMCAGFLGLFSVHGGAHEHACDYGQVLEHNCFSYWMDSLGRQTHLSLPTPQMLRLLCLTAHRRGCFPLSTTVPKNVNKPRLGHLGYTFSENSLVDGTESVHWMAFPG